MSQSFSSKERQLARFLSRFPLIKRIAKAAYARLVYVRSKKNYRFKTGSILCPLADADSESFFGYYDKSPESADGHIICHTVAENTRSLPCANQPVAVALFSPGRHDEAVWQCPVAAYNWQQGTRAHWLNNDMFIFNDYDKDNQDYVARVISKKKLAEVKKFDRPVQDSYGTEYFLSINYRRLMAMRPDYGYRNLAPLTSGELADTKGDGIWKVDFETSESELLVSLADMCDVSSKEEFLNATHKVNHVMISPNGSRFIFLHRYFIGQQRFDRLMLADAATGAIRLLSDNGMVSHCFWIDENTVLGYLRGPDGRDGYWLLDVGQGSFTRFMNPGIGKYGDGHPHVKGEWFVTDTYPDKARMQHLILANWKTGEIREIGEFYHGFGFSGETRCDLHPRFSEDGKSVFFDSVFSGQRRLYKMDVVV